MIRFSKGEIQNTLINHSKIYMGGTNIRPYLSPPHPRCGCQECEQIGNKLMFYVFCDIIKNIGEMYSEVDRIK